MMSFSQLPAPAPAPDLVCSECGATYALGRSWCAQLRGGALDEGG